MKNLNQAVIFCGGLGTRLRPITNSIPKPMVEINKKPFLWYLLDKLSSHPNNIKNFVLLTGYLEEKIKNFFQDGKQFGWKISYSSGPKEWETGRRLWEAKEYLNEKFILCYSDNFAQVSIPKILKINEQNNSSISLLITKKGIGNVKINDSNNNISYQKERNPNYELVELGFMICKKNQVFNYFNKLNESPNIDFSRILEKLSIDNKLSGYLIKDPYYSIGDLHRLEKTREYLNPKRIILLDRDGVINVKAERGKYITSWDEFYFIDDTIQALEQLALEGFRFILISNQAGISTGDITENNLKIIHNKMIEYLELKGINILDIFVSTDHWQSKGFRRKPNPGMFFEASEKYLLRLDQTFYVGDDKRDCEAANKASCGSILIGNNINDISCSPDYRSKSLTNMVPIILKKFIDLEDKFSLQSFK